MTSPYPNPHVYQHPYPYAPQPVRLPAHPRATTAMVLGIVGVAGFFVLLVPILVSPLAWYFGAVAEREAERHPTRYRHAGEARTGMVLGMIGTAILGFALLMLFVAGTLILVSQRHDAGYGT
ncbi:DUF4190 domain-containing protein [Aeromicrobium sp. 9AM]|uniref:DUF4190 domain-containing protein n=1 Tax=Aeromicrobium sp. 9AM TaxID=2653126 RepID=UPI0012F1FD50|nr:DUF4190 domain-containing protein [Aeromicrobium sp. 9AM]VXA95255.1 conserved hypothetical protein [Aeromicrobium sp. 9AM]